MDDLSSKFRCQRAADNEFPACVTSPTTTHADYDQAKKLVLVFVLVLWAKAFCYRVWLDVTAAMFLAVVVLW